MNDIEFVNALATEVRTAMATERAHHAEVVAGLRADVAALELKVQEAAPGEKGMDGRDGRDGRDGITEERLQKAVAEMEVRVAENVVASIEIDGRDLKVGGVVKRRLPIPEYRGVYAPGGYEKGDMVSWGGSLWICDAETADKPADGSAAWRLVAKRGRDGRDRA
jgi:hypothetical protein